MAKFNRPLDDFWVTDLKSDLDIVHRHTAAGFTPVPPEVVRLRLFILYDFLWTNGLITGQLAAAPDRLDEDTALHNRHLTDDGYRFLQAYLHRWQARLYKHTNEAKERAFLKKWYELFLASNEGRTKS